MPTRLQIVFDGDVAGLPEHRLSLGEFGPALTQLLAAARRIASNIYQDAHGPDHGAKGGRLARVAEQIDIQILSVTGDSPTSVAAEIVAIAPPGSNLPLYGDLTELAGLKLLESIDSESQGRPSSAVVRKYLQALPEGLTGQCYTLIPPSGQTKTVNIGEMRLADFADDLPELVECHGEVSGVGFPPGKSEVKIRTDSRDVVCAATQAQVDRALLLRGSEVSALFVTGKPSRLLAIWEKGSSAPSYAYDPEHFLFERWDGLLRRLAQ